MTTTDPRVELLTDKRRFIETLISIPTKEREMSPFTFNSIQDDYWPCRTRRDIVLKPRQVGWSTLILGEILAEALTVDNTVGVIISHKEYATHRLLARLQAMYDSIIELVQRAWKWDVDTIHKRLIPEMKHKSAFEKTFPAINSTIYVDTAKAATTVLGETIHIFLGDELARWDFAGEIMSEVSEAVPRSGRIVLVSTPWGEGGMFHDLVTECLGGDSLYKLHFYPWFTFEEYSLPPGSEYALERDRVTPLRLTEEEEHLQVLYHLTENQIRWRRMKYVECLETGHVFIQQYPEDPVTCFLATGDMVFDRMRLDELARQCYAAPFSFEGAEIWYGPTPGGLYVIGADPTKGIICPAAAVVWHIGEKITHCATLTGMYEPLTFAQKLVSLGKHYNNALLVPEANAEGVPLLAALTGYGNIYKRRDLVTGRDTGQLGWYTTAYESGTKVYIRREMEACLPNIVTHDIRLVRELRGFRYDGLKIVSMLDTDIAMAAMIGIAARGDSASAAKGYIGRYGENWWGD